MLSRTMSISGVQDNKQLTQIVMASNMFQNLAQFSTVSTFKLTENYKSY